LLLSALDSQARSVLCKGVSQEARERAVRQSTSLAMVRFVDKYDCGHIRRLPGHVTLASVPVSKYDCGQMRRLQPWSHQTCQVILEKCREGIRELKATKSEIDMCYARNVARRGKTVSPQINETDRGQIPRRDRHMTRPSVAS
jgi:hypothetical protein